ncbi:MlaA family lipoprotein [Lichenicoccus sp.]|uniref:MlaA family lipoprotein n=1 Tax=Lichenicoccus sp. TaxID=2781899 RepID=UPI003D0E0E56
MQPRSNPSRRHLRPAVSLLSLLAMIAGCATPPAASDPDAVADFKSTNDPLEPTNRFFYAVNDGILTYALTPVARQYRALVPQPVRTGIHNVLNNMGMPVQFVDDVLEAKSRRAGDTFMRFALNTTVGIGGVLDVAKQAGYPDHNADGGTTLALWGVPAGPYLYLPVFGPSGLRDGIGRGMDAAYSPFTWLSFDGSNSLGWSQAGLGALDQTSAHLKDIEQVKAGALDPYATFRSLYRQLRVSQVNAIRNDDRATVPDWYPNAGPNQATRPRTPVGLSPRPVLTPAAALPSTGGAPRSS